MAELNHNLEGEKTPGAGAETLNLAVTVQSNSTPNLPNLSNVPRGSLDAVSAGLLWVMDKSSCSLRIDSFDKALVQARLLDLPHTNVQSALKHSSSTAQSQDELSDLVSLVHPSLHPTSQAAPSLVSRSTSTSTSTLTSTSVPTLALAPNLTSSSDSLSDLAVEHVTSPNAVQVHAESHPLAAGSSDQVVKGQQFELASDRTAQTGVEGGAGAETDVGFKADSVLENKVRWGDESHVVESITFLPESFGRNVNRSPKRAKSAIVLAILRSTSKKAAKSLLPGSKESAKDDSKDYSSGSSSSSISSGLSCSSGSKGLVSLENIASLVKAQFERGQPLLKTLLGCKHLLKQIGVKVSKVAPGSLKSLKFVGPTQPKWAYALTATATNDRYYVCEAGTLSERAAAQDESSASSAQSLVQSQAQFQVSSQVQSSAHSSMQSQASSGCGVVLGESSVVTQPKVMVLGANLGSSLEEGVGSGLDVNLEANSAKTSDLHENWGESLALMRANSGNLELSRVDLNTAANANLFSDLANLAPHRIHLSVGKSSHSSLAQGGERSREVAFDPTLSQQNVAVVGEQGERDPSIIAQASLGVANCIGLPIYDVTGEMFLAQAPEQSSIFSHRATQSDSSSQAQALVLDSSTSQVQSTAQNERCMTQKNDTQLPSGQTEALAKLQAFERFLATKDQEQAKLQEVSLDKAQAKLATVGSVQSTKTSQGTQPMQLGQTNKVNQAVHLGCDAQAVQSVQSSVLAQAQAAATDYEVAATRAIGTENTAMPVGQRRALFAQDFGIEEDAQKRRDYAAAFKVGDLERIFQELKERSANPDWLSKLGHAPLVTRLALHVCARWLRRRCTQLQLHAPHSIQDGEMEIYYDTVCLLIQTMTFAMRVDENINEQERQALYDFCLNLFGSQITSIRGEVDRCLTMPLEISNLVQKVRYPEERLDIFMLSAVILDGCGFICEGYLENLAACLEIDPSLQRFLRARARNLVELGDSCCDFKELDRLYSEHRAGVSALGLS